MRRRYREITGMALAAGGGLMAGSLFYLLGQRPILALTLTCIGIIPLLVYGPTFPVEAFEKRFRYIDGDVLPGTYTIRFIFGFLAGLLICFLLWFSAEPWLSYPSVWLGVSVFFGLAFLLCG